MKRVETAAVFLQTRDEYQAQVQEIRSLRVESSGARQLSIDLKDQ